MQFRASVAMSGIPEDIDEVQTDGLLLGEMLSGCHLHLQNNHIKT